MHQVNQSHCWEGRETPDQTGIDRRLAVYYINNECLGSRKRTPQLSSNTPKIFVYIYFRSSIVQFLTQTLHIVWAVTLISSE